MVQKPLRYGSRKHAEMAIRLHKFESTKVSGPGSSRRKITDILWTKNEAMEAMSVLEEEILTFESLLKSLEEQNHLMKIPECLDGEDGYVTRTAETLRIIGHTYEYWHRGRPGVDAIRWEIVPKKIPRRDIKPDDFISRLIDEVSNKSGEDHSESKFGIAISKVIRGIVKHFREVEKIPNPRFSEFQYRATRDGLFDALGYGGKGTILVAGVGSGKTLAFMLAPLILAKKDILEGVRNYRAHLFLYPRKALALDQFTKSLKPYAFAVGIPVIHVHSEMRKHYSSLETKSVYRGIEDIHGRRRKRPRLVVSSLETLKNRISHPTIVGNLFSRLQTVTIDEVHLQSGVQGAQVAMLMRRIRHLSPNDTTWIGASATIAKPEEHLARLMGIDSSKVMLIEPDEKKEMDVDGVVHHSFMRPSGLISQTGVLTNATSLMVHHRRDDLSKRPGPEQSKKAPKVITFADNLELLGAWNDDLRENERTDEYDSGFGQFRRHPNSENVHEEDEWDQLQRELPYARRFQDTLERRIENYGGIIPDNQDNAGEQALAPVFPEWRGKNVCQRCKDGERFEIGKADLDTMTELSKLVHRAPFKIEDPVLPFRIQNDIFFEESVVGTMDMCPYLQSGTCTSFSSHPVEEVKRIGDTTGRVKYDFAARATSWIQSSKSEDYSEGIEDLALTVFRAPNDILHSVQGAKGEDFVDVVMASPSLEVGVDLPNLTESVMTKAVRNLASYRQKAGRVGRESMSEALNLTMATDSSNDLHYYRQPRKLIDKGRLEPVPLKEKNEAVAKSTAYLAIWDCLVKRGDIPEALLEGDPRLANAMISNSFDYVSDSQNRNDLHAHINSVLDDERYPVGTDWFDSAIEQVKDELSLLLRPISGYRFDPELPEPRTVIAGIRHHRGIGKRKNAAIPIDDANELVEEFERSKEVASKRLSNLGFLREDNSEILDRIYRVMGLYSPEINEMEELIDDIEQLQKTEYNERTEQKSKLKSFMRSLDDYLEAVRELQKSNIDMLAFRAIEQYQNLTAKGNEDSWKSYYFSAMMRTLDVFKHIRKDPWFISPDALYIHPHMKQVRLTDPESADRPQRQKHLSLRDDQALIPLSEALHSFLPGMWTRRLPQTTFKVLARETERMGGNFTLQANLDLMEENGLKYEIIDKSLPAPPGLVGQIQVISPTEIPVRPLINKRTIQVAEIGPEVLDKDEGDPRGHANTLRPRIPKSFSQSWLHVKLEHGTSVSPYVDLAEDEKLMLSNPMEGVSEEIEPQEIVHPLAESAFSSIEWHEDAKVTEYVYGLQRTLRGGDYDGSEIYYANSRGAYTSFGQKINTEGIAFKLNPENVEGIIQNAASEILEGKPEWSPTMIRSLRAFLRYITGTPLSNFVLDDIVGVLIAHWRNNDSPSLSLEKVVELVNEICEDYEILENLVTLRVDARLRTPEDATQITLEDVNVRLRRIEEMIDNVRGNLERFSEHQEEFVQYLTLWLHRTILMSFGVSAVSATQRIAGGDSNEIGFGLTDESWEGNETTVLVYDKAECGNGNVSVARTFLHIPNISRSAKGRRGGFLPSMDFMSSLEEVMLPCAQHHCDLLGLEYQRTNGEDSVLHRSMTDYTQFGKEIHHVGNDVWKSIGISGPIDGWKLPLFHYIRREMAVGELEQDDVTRATRICWNGCPECIERIDVVQGGFAGLDYLDKSVIDYWFRGLRENSDEYVDIEPDSLLDGSSNLQLGDLHSIVLEPQDPRRAKIRSLMLPWTIGVNLNRSNLEEGIRLIIRQSDLVGYRQSEPNEGVALGMPSSAFKRLLWFDLLMTAYLDLRGAFSNEDKEIKLVYYDARDISFDDVGLAPQLLEALKAQARIDKAGHLETFSDMLIWLAIRGFRIQMCVDKRVRQNPENADVRNFINRLRTEKAQGRIELYERSVSDDNEWTASMHKKTMITPIFVLKGTANMTRSGAERNEEDVDHVMFGNPQYESMKTSSFDTISRATRLN